MARILAIAVGGWLIGMSAASAAESIAVGAPSGAAGREQDLADEIARHEAEAARVIDRARPENAQPAARRTVNRDTAEARRYTDALNALSFAGYKGVDSITPEGDNFRALAILDGRRVEVIVNPDTGLVEATRR
jgi:hypothetical protein